MMIDEIIKEMEEEYTAFLEGTGLDDSLRMEKERKNNPDCDKVCTANEMALDILRKYQKIQEILKDDTYYEEYGNNAEKFIVSAIREAIEDGNDD